MVFKMGVILCLEGEFSVLVNQVAPLLSLAASQSLLTPGSVKNLFRATEILPVLLPADPRGAPFVGVHRLIITSSHL